MSYDLMSEVLLNFLKYDNLVFKTSLKFEE